MQDKKSIRALSWIGGGGAALASVLLITAAVVAATPDTPTVAHPVNPGKTTGTVARAHREGARRTAPHTRSYPGVETLNVGISGSVAAGPLLAPLPAAPPAPKSLPAWTTSLQQEHLSAPIVAAASARDGKELLLAGADGGLFPVGSAGFFGSLGGTRLSGRISAVAADPATGGYWMAGSDGGVFAFHASYHGTLSGHRLTSPVVAMAATPSGDGYWLASRDGGVFTFGRAGYDGNAMGRTAGSPITAFVASVDGQGYWLAGSGGSVFAFGDAPAVGQSASSAALAAAALPPFDPSAHRVASSDVSAYPAGATGVDISSYQCGQIPPGRTAIAVVQVTSGAIDNPPNPCYVQEAAWAGPQLSAYIYMDGLPRPAPASSLTGPAGNCELINAACESFNYGYNWARHWVAYSRSVGVYPALWWLDVERYSGWKDTVSNDLVISGAFSGLRSMGVQGGVYSTRTQWEQITGGLVIPGVEVWTAGAGNQSGPGYSADSYCADPGRYTFAGGTLKMVQFGYQGPFPGSFSGPTDPYDLDLACR